MNISTPMAIAMVALVLLTVVSVAALCARLSAIATARATTKRLAQITDAIETFARGETVPLAPGGGREISRLVDAFVRMREEIARKAAALCDQIEERNGLADLLENAIAHMVDPVTVADADGTIILINSAAEKIFGPIRGMNLRNPQAFHRLSPDGVSPLPEGQWPMLRALGGESCTDVEFVVEPSGPQRRVHLVANSRPIRSDRGHLLGAVGVYHDVTGARKAEEALRDSESLARAIVDGARDSGYVTNAVMRDLTERTVFEARMRQAQKMESIGQLTGGIAHDFNNMLTVITGTIDILADGLADRPRLLNIARLISEAADRGADLTRHLLAVARKQPLEPCDTDVNALIGGLQKLLKSTLGERIEVETLLQQAVWPIFVDRGQLDAALINLALNARDAMPDGGRLTLETCNVTFDYDFVRRIGEVEPGAYVMIVVSDSGIGIPAAMRDKVFEPFFTTKEVGKGTGLGLSMVYGFIKQSGGHVTLYSEVGQGTTLRIFLPRAKSESGERFTVSEAQAVRG